MISQPSNVIFPTLVLEGIASNHPYHLVRLVLFKWKHQCEKKIRNMRKKTHANSTWRVLRDSALTSGENDDMRRHEGIVLWLFLVNFFYKASWNETPNPIFVIGVVTGCQSFYYVSIHTLQPSLVSQPVSGSLFQIVDKLQQWFGPGGVCVGLLVTTSQMTYGVSLQITYSSRRHLTTCIG